MSEDIFAGLLSDDFGRKIHNETLINTLIKYDYALINTGRITVKKKFAAYDRIFVKGVNDVTAGSLRQLYRFYNE